MSKRSLGASLVLVFVLCSITFSIRSAAAMPRSKSHTAQRHAMTTTGRPLAQTEAYREYWCRKVTAEEVRIFSTSTSSTVVGMFRKGYVFATTGIANNRYHAYDPYNDTWYGWVTADPQWTDYFGHSCFE